MSELAQGRRVAFVYAALVLLVGAVLALLPQHMQDTVVLESSTNLTTLTQHPFGVLFASAFVVSNVGGPWQLPLLLWGYGAVERWLGAAAAVIVGVLGHVGATLLVATVLVTGIRRGVFNLEVSRVADVGVSYGLAAVGGLLVVRVPRRYLLLYLVLVGVFLVGGLLAFRSFTALGHLTAFLIGLSLAQLVRVAAGSSARLP